MTIAHILADRTGAVASVGRDATVRDAVALLAERRIGALPVVDDGRPVGIYSERDLLRCVHEHGMDVLDQSVAEVMTAPPVTVTAETSVLVALSLMTKRRIRHLPVVDGDGRMVEFISIGDLVKFRMDRIESEAESLRDYIAQ